MKQRLQDGMDAIYRCSPPAAPATEAQLTAELERLLCRENLVAGRDRVLLNLLLAGRSPQLAVSPEALQSHPRVWATAAAPAELLSAARASAILKVDDNDGLIYPQLQTNEGSIIFRDVPADVTAADFHKLLSAASPQLLTLEPWEEAAGAEKADENCSSSDDATGRTADGDSAAESPAGESESSPPAESSPGQSPPPAHSNAAHSNAAHLNAAHSRIAATAREAELGPPLMASCAQLASVTVLPTSADIALTFSDYNLARSLAWRLRTEQLAGRPVSLRLRQAPPVTRETLCSSSPMNNRRSSHQQQPRRQQRRGVRRRPENGKEQVVVVAPSEFPTLSDAAKMKNCGYGVKPFTLRTPAEIKSRCEQLPPQERPAIPAGSSELLAVFTPKQRSAQSWPSNVLQKDRIRSKLHNRPAAKSATVRGFGLERPSSAAPPLAGTAAVPVWPYA